MASGGFSSKRLTRIRTLLEGHVEAAGTLAFEGPVEHADGGSGSADLHPRNRHGPGSAERLPIAREMDDLGEPPSVALMTGDLPALRQDGPRVRTRYLDVLG